MQEPRWLSELEATYIHDEAVRIHGGLPGTRDVHLVSASVARPRFKFHYEGANLLTCGAAYAFAFAGNHPFHDGNKRTAFGTLVVFLLLNGWELDADSDEYPGVSRPPGNENNPVRWARSRRDRWSDLRKARRTRI